MNEKRWFVHDNPAHPQSQVFLKELDEFDFQRVSRIHTAKAYKEYLGYHFDGKHVRRARYWRERLNYQEMLESKEPGALEKFLEGFSEGWFQEVSGVDLQKSEYEAQEEKRRRLLLQRRSLQSTRMRGASGPKRPPSAWKGSCSMRRKPRVMF